MPSSSGNQASKTGPVCASTGDGKNKYERDFGAATCADAGGDGGTAEAFLLDDEAGADEAAGEERQDYPLHVVRRQLRPGFSSSSPHPCSPLAAPPNASTATEFPGFRPDWIVRANAAPDFVQFAGKIFDGNVALR
jgi:hypothetical protein